ncbi:MAG: hypothetical protein EXX96DRAFT_612420 [Benjaminiella poitrasii]|nr:MAG: hypothetical protein EXX96DRAFT_612420 [Benjaminiella poitrasii]
MIVIFSPPPYSGYEDYLGQLDPTDKLLQRLYMETLSTHVSITEKQNRKLQSPEKKRQKAVSYDYTRTDFFSGVLSLTVLVLITVVEIWKARFKCVFKSSSFSPNAS